MYTKLKLRSTCPQFTNEWNVWAAFHNLKGMRDPWAIFRCDKDLAVGLCQIDCQENGALVAEDLSNNSLSVCVCVLLSMVL